jgi:hypothetical protein
MDVTSTSERSEVPHEDCTPKTSARNGTRRTLTGAAGSLTPRAGANTCVFDVAATPIDSGAVEGDPVEPRPKSSRSFPAEATTTTPALVTLATVGIIASERGSIAADPPE